MLRFDTRDSCRRLGMGIDPEPAIKKAPIAGAPDLTWN